MTRGFTGLYTVYRYYIKWGIFIFRHREGAYDYINNRGEEVCDFKKETNIECICISPSIAKFILEQLKQGRKSYDKRRNRV